MSPAIIASISGSGTSRRNLIVSACEWQRIAPMRTHSESTGIAFASVRPRILFDSAPPFHSSRLMPVPMSLSIHGISEPASGTPKFCVGKFSSRRMPATSRSMSRIADAGSASRSFATRCASPIWDSSSRMFCAPAPEAAWYVMHVIHSIKSRRKRPDSAISIRLTVQLPPM